MQPFMDCDFWLCPKNGKTLFSKKHDDKVYCRPCKDSHSKQHMEESTQEQYMAENLKVSAKSAQH